MGGRGGKAGTRQIALQGGLAPGKPACRLTGGGRPLARRFPMAADRSRKHLDVKKPYMLLKHRFAYIIFEIDFISNLIVNIHLKKFNSAYNHFY
jgi:hypothetical protein